MAIVEIQEVLRSSFTNNYFDRDCLSLFAAMARPSVHSLSLLSDVDLLVADLVWASDEFTLNATPIITSFLVSYFVPGA